MMQLQFPGLSANQFYQLIKQKSIQWKKLTKFDIILNRFDLVYERINKSTDKIDTKEFLNSSYIQFQESHPYRNLVSERNRKGLILKIGNRKGQRHYRIYTRNNSLRFEAELKGDLIKDFHDLLIASDFEEQDFETRLSYQYFKYSFELFSPSNQTSHLDWLMNRIRPFQYKNTLILDDSMIHSALPQSACFQSIERKTTSDYSFTIISFCSRIKVQHQTINIQISTIFAFHLESFLNITTKLLINTN